MYNAKNFMEWFWTEIGYLISWFFNTLDDIKIGQNITILDFSLIIIVIIIIAKIVISAPLANDTARVATPKKEKKGKK